MRFMTGSDTDRWFDFTAFKDIYSREELDVAQAQLIAEAVDQNAGIATFLIEAAYSDVATTRLLNALDQSHATDSPNRDNMDNLRRMFSRASLGSFAIHMSSHSYEDILGFKQSDPLTHVPQIIPRGYTI